MSAQDRAAMLAKKSEREAALLRALQASRMRGNHFARTVEALCVEPVLVLERAQERERVIQGCFVRLGPKTHAREAFRDLLLHVDQEGCDNLLRNAAYVQGLARLAEARRAFIRPIGEWSRPSRNVHVQFSSLLRHCLARYPVPLFMDQAWCEPEADQHRNWFINIGAGCNIRHSKGIPIEMTKRMAHCFLQAPADLRIEEAMRWAQVVGAHGNDRIARAVISTQLGRMGFANEPYWSGVIGFIIREDLHHPGKLGEIVDYLSHRLHMGEPLDISGRTSRSITRLSDAWHQEMTRVRGTLIDRSWEPSEISGRAYTTGKDEEKLQWTITELMSVSELTAEGRAMAHCVGSYAPLCASRATAIFSLTSRDVVGNARRHGTIEVSLKTRRIVQAKGRFNAQLKATARAVIDKWASDEGLMINKHL